MRRSLQLVTVQDDKKTAQARDLSVVGRRIYIEFERWRVNCPQCRSVRVEHLDWLAENPRYTQRFALHVGGLCREMPVSRVAEIERLHHSKVKELDKIYTRRQIELKGDPKPRAIGIDEISIRKGHNYRIVVSDLKEHRPIWIGGDGRKEEDLDEFFIFLGNSRAERIDLVVMDIWKAFRNSTQRNAPNAQIIYDKFHIMSHLSKALDQVRRDEYKRLSGQDKSFIKGQRYTLLSNKENLDTNGRRSLKKPSQRQQPLEYCLPAKRDFWSTMEL